MRHSFVLSTLKKLLSLGHLSPSDSVLAICAAGPEQQVFSDAGLRVATISNLDDRLIRPDFAPTTGASRTPKT